MTPTYFEQMATMEALMKGVGFWPTRRPQMVPAETILSNFQSGHAWTKQAGAFTQSDDTSEYIRGNQCLKFATGGAAVECKSRWSSISPAIDMTGKYFKLWVKINDVANLNRLWIYAASTPWTAYYAWKPSDAPSHWNYANNVWLPITLSFGQAVQAGTPARDAIVALQLYAQDKNGVSVDVQWGGLSAIAEASAGVLTIAFDDGWASCYSEARKTMDSKGFPGTAYVIPDLINTAGYMTLAQLKSLDSLGWDISGHHQTNFNTLGSLEDNLKLIKAWLLSNGFSRGADDFALPGGVWDETTIMPLVKEYYRSCRTIIPYSETLPVGDIHKLRITEVANTTSTATIAAAVTRAITNKEWLILVYHRLVTSPTVSTEHAIADFATEVADIASQGIAVKTVSEVLG